MAAERLEARLETKYNRGSQQSCYRGDLTFLNGMLAGVSL